MNLPLNRRLSLWFALTLSLMVGAGAMAAWAVLAAREGERWMLHSRDVIDFLNEISTAVGESEASARAYLQSGNSRYLASYQARHKAEEYLSRRLGVLIQDNPSQVRHYSVLKLRLEENDRLIEQMLMATGTSAGSWATEDPQDNGSSRLRAALAQMKGEEERLLAQRVDKASRAEMFAMSAGGAALLLDVLITYAVFTRIRKEASQRVTAEENLRVSNDGLATSLEKISVLASRLEKTIENMPIGVLLLDASLRIVSFNDRLLEVLRLPIGVVKVGETTDSMLEYGLEHGDRSAEDIEAAMARRDALQRNPAPYRIGLQMRGGRLVEAIGRPVPGGGFVALYTDITEERVEAERLEQARRDAEDIARTKSEFLAVMSHEVRTPMNGVLGLAELLLDTPLSPEQRNSVETILRSGESLLNILNNILDLSKIDADRVELEARPFKLSEVLDDISALWRSGANARGLTLQLEVADETPDHLIGDPGRLKQILGNLVGNAVKFTQQGLVQISVRALSLTDTEASVRFAVKDTGIGMSADEKERLFQPFSQADASTTRKFGGTGLGLAISRGLAERLGGNISVESEKGRGSTFVLLVKFSLGAPQDAGIKIPMVRKPAAIEHGFAGCVLLVEDNPVNRAVANASLAKLGLQVKVAEDGLAALALIQNEHFDLVLMDMHMPVMDGLAATREIRRLNAKTAAGAPLPIVAMTANVLPEAQRACLDAGMDDFLPKPFPRSQLIALLGRWLRKDVAATPLATSANHVPTFPAQPAILDAARFELLKQTMKDDLQELLADFERSTRKTIAVLAAASDKEDRAAAVKAAHNIGSSAATIGAMKLSGLARQLEDGAHVATLDAMQILAGRIDRAFKEYLEVLRTAALS